MCAFLMKIIRKLNALLNYKRTKKKCNQLVPVKKFETENYILRGADTKDFERLKVIYSQFNNYDLSKLNMGLFKRQSEKLILVSEVINGSKSNIVGMELFYFNPRDFKAGTIHEGFIGVLPEFEGRGIATAMRKHAIAHFRLSGLNGISTRISKNNISSLRSAERLGFKPVEEYFDPVMQEDRYYLVYNFENNL
ncbi:TPA: N-acetyltransferase [Vibrio cholerae]|uniref:GNAT family N-acetyltransferase n=1 Tax=Vibrio cholerae TaxID=666 RepID=UPI0021D1CB6A|nr:GNAT family N-acetyltransferase [Vibrio cholerae]MCU4221735.1 GNAT family N-acetyltransferase [Vibrio cholerae]HCZ9577165.1 N-acetyltransferase [Vibrio cholerae]HCZ9602186.1 N-acetyltransferase [Vibrio cholerae]HCZ9637848.1 N-acetyltransferase [Vibrio cholerae]HCZ9645133.1 N-acetyltransferase [Vibrio cholerae]